MCCRGRKSAATAIYATTRLSRTMSSSANAGLAHQRRVGRESVDVGPWNKDRVWPLLSSPSLKVFTSSLSSLGCGSFAFEAKTLFVNKIVGMRSVHATRLRVDIDTA